MLNSRITFFCMVGTIVSYLIFQYIGLIEKLTVAWSNSDFLTITLIVIASISSIAGILWGIICTSALNDRESPYLSDETRLADVIAAIQAMGTYKFYKLDTKEWAKRISGNALDAPHWNKIITEHPEFFRLNEAKDRASLVLRRNYQRAYHVDKNIELTREQRELLPEDELNKRVSRLPLSNSDIAVLVNTAISLHSRALENKKASRWWVTPVFSLIGLVAGVLLQKNNIFWGN